MLLSLHRWLGATLTLYVALVALSGLLLLWADDYRRWRYPSLPASASLPAAATLARVAADAGGPVTLAMPTASLPAVRAYGTDGGGALYHPLSGERVAAWRWHDSLPAFLFELHADLLGGATGHRLSGILGCGVLLMLPTGGWLWWRQRRRFGLRRLLPRDATETTFRKSHAVQGAWFLPVMLLTTVSGIAMIFPAPLQAALDGLLGAERATPTVAVARGPAALDWSRALATAAASFLDATLRLATLPGKDGEALRLRLRQPAEWHPNGRTVLWLEPASGRLLGRYDAVAAGAGPAAFNSLYPLHAGKTGWPGYRALLAASAAALAWLSVSGLRLFLGRQRRLARQRRRQSSRP